MQDTELSGRSDEDFDSKGVIVSVISEGNGPADGKRISEARHSGSDE